MPVIRKGAEANLLLEDFTRVLHPTGEGKVLVKHRISKGYRVKELDKNLRESRTALEAKLLADAKRAGVPTPLIYEVDRTGMKIIMEYVEGERVKTFLEDLNPSERQEVCELIGEQIARLHKFGIVHGDLTTSNMIRTQEGKIYFIDFGLGEYDPSTEARGTDLHLLWRTLQSTHHKVSNESFKAVLNGYKREFGESASEIIQRVKEIKHRGRYIPKEERA
ncbi:O-sialoglycoprotein endopeptidase [candidate division MSBL1 archaeon SCGC-AAA261F17]|uniref:non-specific serine/threonine protein kinase n=1 Tax=candidate division MSBL1 archaeon SCGC-AAA261F17 TaxID=1698274 RepID=A0A133V691_9EURY|nr:O-sialoglycoprotein endopeptidase [candidate division MSBL1 archaeon SCGC-AAA261F17]